MRRIFLKPYQLGCRMKLCLLLLLIVAGSHGQKALAATETVPLKRLHINDVILLPTVSSQYEAQFTKPQTWQLASSSKIELEFQHSIELLPNRSWLQIIINDKVIKHIPLTRENAEGTRMTIPVPVTLLKDFNRLDFRVQQHYTDKCEDPLDKSLWTQILPSTRLVFDYTPVLPKVDLGLYPYPLIDPLTYSPAKIHYVTGNQASTKELQSLAYVNVHLAQQAQEHEMKSRVTFGNPAGPGDEHVVFVGKGGTIPDVARYQAAFGNYALQGDQWVNRAGGQPLANDAGLILLFQAPDAKEHTVLVVTGNTDEAVLNAARYLTMRPKDSMLLGSAKEVPSGWTEPGGRTNKTPRYIDTQTRTFRELGFKIEEVHKINAPPITYKVPVVSKFRKSGGKLWLDLVYSYSPNLNPEFSSLELRMNDISIANIPLMNTAGEQLLKTSIPVSNELVQPRNNLVAQFHLMPDKYGWCVDNYVDNAWGKIMDDSQFRVDGTPGSYLPDIGLLNDRMYPYSEDDNLERVQLVLSSSPTPELLNAMLGFTTRLGRTTLADTDLRLTVSQGHGDLEKGKNVALFRFAKDAMNLPAGAKLLWKTTGSLQKLLTLTDPGNGTIVGQLDETGNGLYMEQYRVNGDRILSLFTAHQPKAFVALGQLFESDENFETLASGFLQQTSPLLQSQPNTVSEIAYHFENREPVQGSWWSGIVQWAKNLPWVQVIVGLVIGLLFLILLPVLIRAILRK